MFLKKWNKKTTEVDEEYFMLTTKRCYHCKCPSERISGYNHITCPLCHKEWCWMCGGDWSIHGSQTGGYYQCNIYDAGKGIVRENEKKAANRGNEVFRLYRTT